MSADQLSAPSLPWPMSMSITVMPETLPVTTPILDGGEPAPNHASIWSVSDDASFNPVSVLGCLPASVHAFLPQEHSPSSEIV
jgi:hypothetical protein